MASPELVPAAVASTSRAISEELPEIVSNSRSKVDSSLHPTSSASFANVVPSYGHPRYDPSRKDHVRRLTAECLAKGWPREAALRNLADLLDYPDTTKPAYPYWVIARAAILSTPEGETELSAVVRAVVEKYPYVRVACFRDCR